MNDLYKIALNPSVGDFSLAFAPINNFATVGNLNAKILLAYGYDEAVLKGLQLEKGYDLFELNGRPIVFVVTIDGGKDTAGLLRENLYNAIANNTDIFWNRKIFLPLLGTGNGNLSYEESYKIISGVLKDHHDLIVKSTATITIAIPTDNKGKALFDKLNQQNRKDSVDDLEILLKNSTNRFFLVGSSWSGDEQADRFYEEGIWQTGYDENKYGDIINSLEKGDFLIHKSAYPNREGETYLRFKGWGRVIDNPQDGITVQVKWYEKGHKIDVKNMGYYRNTIMEPSLYDLQIIFETLPSSITKGFITALRGPIRDEELHHFAGLVSDADTGTDYLDIMPDVNSFALVLAAKTFEPPLAVALLGRWGSGKSFFMKKLKSQIEEFSGSDKNYFCEGIVHVHFNAWSYMDANLWASITTRIFEELNIYISKDSLATQHKKEIEEKLTKDLSVTKEEKAGLEKQKLEIDSQLEKLNAKKSKAKNELDSKISSLRNKSLQLVLSGVDKEFNVSEKFREEATKNPGIAKDIVHFQKIVPEEYWQKPDELYEKAKSLPTLFRLFTTNKDAKFNWIWLIVSFIALIAIPILMLFIKNYFKLHVISLNPSLWFFITLLGSFYVRSMQVLKKVQPFLSKMWSIKKDYLKQRDNAINEFNQQEKALLQEIEYKKNELESINSQITNIRVVKSTVEFKINNALSTTALYEFIEKRCNSEDYKKHLGLVSVIRKDFMILSELFTGHREEVSQSGDSEEFQALFEKPLQRIVLYIDDLDRCPEDRVIEVLEAVNLLMAFPLFVVIVGVDPIWVRNALTTKYKQQFKYEEKDHNCIEPSDYLEKIFQIAFHLKVAEDSSIKSMLRGLSQVEELPHVANIVQSAIDTPNEAGLPTQVGIVPKVATKPEADTAETQKMTKDTIVRALNFLPDERYFIEDMSYILGSNPRLVKRYINIYRIVKSHNYMNSRDIDKNDLESVMLLLALSLSRYRPLMPVLHRYFNDANEHYLLSHFLDKTATVIDRPIVEQLKIELKELLNRYKPSLLEAKVLDMKKHADFIKRFAF